MGRCNRRRWGDVIVAQQAIHGYLQSVSGLADESLKTSQEAVRYFRELVEIDAGKFLPDLAASLGLEGMLLVMQKTPESLCSALLPTRESAEHYRALDQVHPDSYRHNIAMMMETLSTAYQMLKDDEHALGACLEVVREYRILAASNPKKFLHKLASGLVSLSEIYGRLRQSRSERATLKEAVEAYRASTEDTSLEDVTRTLNRLVFVEIELGEVSLALVTARDSVASSRQLVESCVAAQAG